LAEESSEEVSSVDSSSTEDLPATARVIRVIRAVDITEPDETGAVRPKSSNFSDGREEGNGMSVFLEPDILAAHRDPYELLDLPFFSGGSRLSWLLMSDYRNEGQTITRKPIPEFPGHAEVKDLKGRRSAGTRSRMAHRSTWL
jgi:hypothetical protein